jgi:Flp pilus assembly protein TadD
VGLVTLFVVNTSFFGARGGSPSQETAKVAVALLQDGQVTEGRELLEKVHAESPNSAKITYLYGQALSMEGRKEDAIRLFRASLDLNPTDPTLLLHLGESFLLEGLFTEAVEALSKVTELRSESVEAWISLGRAQEAMKDTTAAADSYRRAMAVAPEDQRGYLNLGYLHQMLGQPEEAVQVWEEGRTHVASSFTLHFNLAIAYLETGRREAGLYSIERALELRPQDPEALQVQRMLKEQPDSPR